MNWPLVKTVTHTYTYISKVTGLHSFMCSDEKKKLIYPAHFYLQTVYVLFLAWLRPRSPFLQYLWASFYYIFFNPLTIFKLLRPKCNTFSLETVRDTMGILRLQGTNRVPVFKLVCINSPHSMRIQPWGRLRVKIQSRDTFLLIII